MTDFVATKARFHLPKGVIYLDGNSLGPLPEGAMHRAQQTIESEWGEMLICAWNSRRLDGPAAPRRRQDRAADRCGARNSGDGRHVVDQNVPGARCSVGDASRSQDRALRHRQFPNRSLHGEGSYPLAGSWPRSQDGGARGGRGRHRRERRRAHKRPLAPVSVPAPLASRRPVPGAAYRQKKRPTTAPRPNATTSASTICRRICGSRC